TLLDRIGSLREQGVTVLFVEHDMEVVTRISDGVVCMAQGRVIAEGTPAEVVADPAVVDAYLATHHGERGGTRGSRCSRHATSWPATSRASTSSTAVSWRSTRASWSVSSDPTARASRRSCRPF